MKVMHSASLVVAPALSIPCAAWTSILFLTLGPVYPVTDPERPPSKSNYTSNPSNAYTPSCTIPYVDSPKILLHIVRNATESFSLVPRILPITSRSMIWAAIWAAANISEVYGAVSSSVMTAKISWISKSENCHQYGRDLTEIGKMIILCFWMDHPFRS